jgi:hypothetical protein
MHHACSVGFFDSKAAGEPVSCSVFKPESYDAAKESRFPVLYWLHGSSCNLPDCRRAWAMGLYFFAFGFGCSDALIVSAGVGSVLPAKAFQAFWKAAASRTSPSAMSHW